MSMSRFGANLRQYRVNLMGLITVVSSIFPACTGTRPASPDLEAALLTPCGNRPNCVESRPGAAADRSIPPFTAAPDPAVTWKKLETAIRGMDRAEIVTLTDRYMHVEFRSKVFRFVDDAEFLLRPEDRIIHVRSAARLGYRDFGVNRARIESIRILIQD